MSSCVLPKVVMVLLVVMSMDFHASITVVFSPSIKINIILLFCYGVILSPLSFSLLLCGPSISIIAFYTCLTLSSFSVPVSL